jgi:hypothetical protein
MSVTTLPAAAEDLRLEPCLTAPTVFSKFPDPQLSIGERCHPLGRNQCWEVIGPAREASKSIFPATRALLESRYDFVNGDECEQPLVIFGMFMIGKNEKKACPTLLFSCLRKGPRRRAIELAKGEDLLKDFPYIKLAESARPPVALQMPTYLGGLGKMAADENDTVASWIESLAPADAPISYIPKEHVCGTVIAQDKKDVVDPVRSATLGGVVYLKGRRFGLTAAHAFSDSYGQVPLSDICDAEFNFDEGSGEDSDEEEEEDAIVAMTSEGKKIFPCLSLLLRIFRQRLLRIRNFDTCPDMY